MSHWAASYVGLPWKADGEGPPPGAAGRDPDKTWSFHCWAFVRFVQRRHFGRELPEIPNPQDLLAMARAFRDHPERRRWTPVETPAEGDCALMRQARYPIHVGVWVEAEPLSRGGGVLHCIRGSGVVFQRLDALVLHGWRVEGFYRFQDS